MSSLEIGNYVTASYKTGRYIGKIIDFKPKLQKAVVKIVAVLVHPKQGDLHAPNQVDVQLFHERKALAFTEKALVPLSNMKLYDGEIPEYEDSLLNSVRNQMGQLKNDESDYAKASYQKLEILLNDYQK